MSNYEPGTAVCYTELREGLPITVQATVEKRTATGWYILNVPKEGQRWIREDRVYVPEDTPTPEPRHKSEKNDKFTPDLLGAHVEVKILTSPHDGKEGGWNGTIVGQLRCYGISPDEAWFTVLGSNETYYADLHQHQRFEIKVLF